jgi:site-specific recombinase XerD
MDTALVLDSILIDMAWMKMFGQYLADDHGGGQKTNKAYLSDVAIYASWYEVVNGEAFSPESLTNTDLRAFRKWSDAQGVKPATWNRRRAALRVLWGWSKREGYITHQVDIFDGVRTRSTGNQDPKWLDESEFRKMQRFLEKERNQAVSAAETYLTARNMAAFALMAYAGLREAEVCALTVDDIIIKERSGRVEVRNGKGGKARPVVLVEEARAALTVFLAQRGERPDATLFYGIRGEPMGVGAVRGMVEDAAQACGLGHVTPHQLRHTFCHRAINTMVKKGAGDKALLTVAEMAGHSRLDVTRRYVKLSDEEMLNLLED